MRLGWHAVLASVLSLGCSATHGPLLRPDEVGTTICLALSWGQETAILTPLPAWIALHQEPAEGFSYHKGNAQAAIAEGLPGRGGWPSAIWWPYTDSLVIELRPTLGDEGWFATVSARPPHRGILIHRRLRVTRPSPDSGFRMVEEKVAEQPFVARRRACRSITQ